MSGVVRRFTILGSGSSGGVPRADGDWGACDPAEPRNRRRRCSLLVQQWRAGDTADAQAATTVVIDTSPDFREQAIAANLKRLDAVVFTHDHADQSHGLDDVRAFAIRHRRRIPVFLDAPTGATLTRKFAYCFYGEGGYPPILQLMPEITPPAPFAVDGPGGPIPFTPIVQDHGGTISLGFRIGAFGYSNDVVRLDDAAFDSLAGVVVWVVDALRYTPHPTHAHLERALDWIARLAPERAVLTNLHVDLDYARVLAETPPGVEPAFDGLAIEIYEPFPPDSA
ncbi:MAG: MBL fold metallo-hydrolase [Alphaproteobacteria bacterium]|nr:MBL fold metallo-hydrolase [Alphaproteobacteria bacterium]